MINLYVKFNVHSPYVIVIVLEVADRRKDGHAWWRQQASTKISAEA